MSHEIRTPINGAIGLTEILLRTDLSSSQRELADNVRKSADSLLTIVNDILDFSKIEAGKVEFENIDFDLREVVDDTVAVVKFAADDKGIQLEIAAAPERGYYVKGDPGRLKQILLNLVNNAVKFTKEGSVTIHVAVRDDGDRALLGFEVRDTGIGIPEEALGRLFIEFSQADASTTRRYGGTGLGLSISKRLVEGMGGKIRVSSTVGLGSIFGFDLALKKGEKKASSTQASSKNSANSGAVKILLAEDNKVNQLVATKQLQTLGYEADVVANGLEVLAALEKKTYDLILMDCQMPEMDGFEATRKIREQAKYASLPIIALTANAFESDRDQCLQAGMNDFISKPVKIEALGESVTKWLGERATLKKVP